MMGEQRIVSLTETGIKNSYLYLTEHMDFFPEDAIGGTNATHAGNMLEFYVEGIPEPVYSDIDGKNKFIRTRSWIPKFIRIHSLSAGDRIVIERLGERIYRIHPLVVADHDFFEALQWTTQQLANEPLFNTFFSEGHRQLVLSYRYERDQHARTRCIRHYGTNCAVCGFNFGAVYGSIGEGFIHVHHLKPLSECDAEQEIDPIRDLRPVCPNCHAMLHRQYPPYSIEDLRAILGL